MANEHVVVVDNLCKRYGDHTALAGISFSVEAGEVFGLLGPNGAGKTTTLEILEGFRRPDTGRAEVLGVDPAARSTSSELRERIGIVLQDASIEPFLSVRQALQRNAGYYRSPRDVDDVLTLVGLADKADDRVKSLSGGQIRRLDLAVGVVGAPELLFLDEPTTGFDPVARRDFWTLVRSLAQGGTTVLLTTHYMEEADALADRVAVLRGGRVVAEGAPKSLAGRDISEARIRFRIAPATDLATLPVAPTSKEGDIIEILTSDEIAVLHALTNWAVSSEVSIDGLTVERRSLEDVYVALTGGNRIASTTEPQ
ncbi:MAG TPA: ABC transporter ATP-binding protein [Candidatus Saccharimonadales bacterium]|nr:ABC transporter ATP-binding protein [Candidatus Saccharimonadales bacterium]